LADALADFGPDRNAADACRVFRLFGTLNGKSGNSKPANSKPGISKPDAVVRATYLCLHACSGSWAAAKMLLHRVHVLERLPAPNR